MERPPLPSFSSTPFAIRSVISLSAVACEHFVIFAHLSAVSLPSNPSRIRLMILICLSLNANWLMESKNLVFARVEERCSSALSTADAWHLRMYSTKLVMSPVPFSQLSSNGASCFVAFRSREVRSCVSRWRGASHHESRCIFHLPYEKCMMRLECYSNHILIRKAKFYSKYDLKRVLVPYSPAQTNIFPRY